jgi:hypothetical protein
MSKSQGVLERKTLASARPMTPGWNRDAIRASAGAEVGSFNLMALRCISVPSRAVQIDTGKADLASNCAVMNHSQKVPVEHVVEDAKTARRSTASCVSVTVGYLEGDKLCRSRGLSGVSELHSRTRRDATGGSRVAVLLWHQLRVPE